MNNPTDVSNTQPAYDQSTDGQFLMTGKTGSGKAVLVMPLIKEPLNQQTDGDRHD